MTTEPTPVVSLPAPGLPRREQSHILVLLSGIGTTLVALLGVYLLDVTTDDFHIMGWYANYVLPVGALLVGLVASFGYGLASWLTGIKITRGLLVKVLLLQLTAYVAAQYIEFRSLHLVHKGNSQPVGFFEYFDLAARSFAWKQRDGSPSEPLGAWGYAFRLLEMVGFAGGSLIVPAVLRKSPYCQECQLYQHTQALALIPACVRVRKIKKSDTEARVGHDAEHQQAMEKGLTTLDALRRLATENKSTEFQTVLAELASGKKEAGKLPRRLSLSLVSCPRCRSGTLVGSLLTGQGKHLRRQELVGAELSPDFVQVVQPRRRG